MTKPPHPITPPLELVHQWVDMLASRSDHAVFTMAAQWGANQELEACCECLLQEGAWPWPEEVARLRAARRPKPPSLKEPALAVIENSAICDHLSPEHAAILRRALEALDD